MSDDPLQTPVQYVKGVGPATAKLLGRLEINTVRDLLWHLPRDVLDLTVIRPVQQFQADLVQTARGKVVDVDARRLRHGRTLTAVLLNCDGQFLRGTWFNQPWMLKKFQHGENVLFSGKPKKKAGRWEIANPRVQWLEDEDRETTGGVLPRYGLTEGVKMHEMRRFIREGVEKYADQVPEYIPPALRDSCKLPGISDALRGLHLPKTMEEFESSKRRLIFDDLLEFQLGLALRRRSWKRIERAPKLPTTAKIDARIRRLFPFRLTPGQDGAIREICDDLASGRAMHRLLQADVGAGKTAIALYAILVAVAAGYQAVLMAPTELLASQHFHTIEQALGHSRVERRFLTGGLTAKARRTLLEEISSGTAQLIVGTQAVIQKDVVFKKLGLAIIDEQHKFGVMQRAHFSTGDVSPHVLVMTATPIPRSLCLTQFGDLDISTVSDLPPGRQPVVTSRVYNDATRAKAWEFIRKHLRDGRQAYIVCPRVEQDDDASGSDVPGSAEEAFASLRAGELAGFGLEMVHGRMEHADKQAAMDAFRDGSVQALVSTTVIEVGVDVPNATLMVILQAQRFGVSQLHQLRGRVCRGRFPGYCFLFSEASTDEATRRLSALEQTRDGFRIAEVDFELRGPGDVLGTRQHGDLPLGVADLLRDRKILDEARQTAFTLVRSGGFDGPEFAPLKIKVLERFQRLMDLPKSG
ncbi:MAG: ATP-dependent DNA helicase RecG [Planctomycetaceae bacterium]|nr:ATP-dependent DNA helicase RecG [Planctomycetaceae bacterium]